LDNSKDVIDGKFHIVIEVALYFTLPIVPNIAQLTISEYKFKLPSKQTNLVYCSIMLVESYLPNLMIWREPTSSSTENRGKSPSTNMRTVG
jgi:hypothetical protein